MEFIIFEVLAQVSYESKGLWFRIFLESYETEVHNNNFYIVRPQLKCDLEKLYIYISTLLELRLLKLRVVHGK